MMELTIDNRKMDSSEKHKHFTLWMLATFAQSNSIIAPASLESQRKDDGPTWSELFALNSWTDCLSRSLPGADKFVIQTSFQNY